MRWYNQAGTPKLSVSSRYDAAMRSLTLDLAQSTPPTPGQATKELVPIPIALGLVAKGGGDIALKTRGPNEIDGASAEEVRRGVFELTSATRQITFLDVEAPAVPSLLRGFSAPVRLDFDLADNDLMTLLEHDSDTFNRWQAAQTMATRLLIRSVASIRAGGPPLEDKNFVAAIGTLLAGHATDPAFTALAVTLPSEADIAREIAENIDPDAILLARQTLRRQIGRDLAAQWRDLYRDATPEQTYTPDAASAGRRACRNIALDYLAAGDPQTGAEQAHIQLQSADNMTDEIAALGVLSLVPGALREEAFDGFFNAHASDTLVIDKWFALQATIPEPNTLERVRRLMGHPAFSMSNPNRLRALVGTFAAANQTQFNAADGSGYVFLAEIVIALDPKNPQVAARLLGAFRSWRTFEAGRRNHAEAALRRVAAVGSLSSDVRDIVDRTLA
jgi:aminopeptidase N